MADPINDDTDYDFSNLPGGYKEPALALSRKQAESETSAMDLLRQSMQRQAEVTPTQGLASALLAAVPTFGGYLIGKSVGNADVSGLGINSFDEYKKLAGGTGAYAGGLAGAKIGGEASGSFLKGLDEQQAARADVLQKQAQLEAQQGARAGEEATNLVARGLAQQDRERMIPMEEQSQIRIERERARTREATQSGLDAPLPPELQQQYAEQLGVPATTIKSQRDVQSLINLKRITDTNQRQQNVFGHQQSMAQLPDVSVIPGMTPSGKDTANAQEILVNYGDMSKKVVPQLRDVFTRPDATISQKRAALGDAVIAMKKQDNMGASFTDMERKLIQSNLPNIATLSVGELTDFLLAQAEGQDPIKMINDLERDAKIGAENGLRAYKYEFPKAQQQQRAPGGIETKRLKDGTTVKVQRQPDGSYIEVQ